MKVLGKVMVTGIIFSICFVFASYLLAQGTAANVETTQVAPAEIPVQAEILAQASESPIPVEPEVSAAPLSETLETAAPTEAKPAEWVWGEVVSVNSEKKQIVLKHLDYDTYEEVQTTLSVSDKTLFENVVGLGEIKAGNHLTADFKIAAGSNIADLVVVEKDIQEEIAASETAVDPEIAVDPETAVGPVSKSEAPIAINPEAPAATPEQAVNETK